MAEETLKELSYDGSKIIVEVARRDSEGRNIVDTYATKEEIPDAYTLPAATSSTLGGVMVGDGLSITSTGVLSVNDVSWSDITSKPFTSVDFEDFSVVENVLSINESKYVLSTTLTSNYYTSSQVDSLIAAVKTGLITVVESLPSTGEEGIIYLVGTASPYELYVWEGSEFIDLGSSDISLDGYVTGSSLTSGNIILGSGSSSVEASGYTIATSLSNSSTTIPTSAAVYSSLSSKQDTITVGNGLSLSGTEISSVITATDVTINLQD